MRDADIEQAAIKQAATSVTLRWSFAGPIGGMVCTQFREDADPHTWQDNYLCASSDQGLRWNSAGPIGGMRCTQIHEAADPHTWNDNYLCVPNNSSLQLSWSSAGPIGGQTCVQVNEPADPNTWDDNYLCYSGGGGGNPGTIDVVDYMFNDNSRALNIQAITGGGEQQIRAYRANTGFANGFFVTKILDWRTNKAPLFVEWSHDDNWLYLIRDTSWQEGNWCTINGQRVDTAFEMWENGRIGGRFLPRFMNIGQIYEIPSEQIVARFEDGPQKCQVCDSPVDGPSGSRQLRATYLPQKTFSLTGETVNDVVMIEILSGAGAGERYYWHKALGDLGYEDSSGFQSHYRRSEDFPLEIDDSHRCGGGGGGNCGRLGSGGALGRDQILRSCNGAATLAHQGDGNVVVYDRAGALWWTGTSGSTSWFVMQTDGNLVLYNTAGQALWNSRTAGNNGAWMAMQDDCNLVVYNSANRPIWASNRFCR